VRGTLFIILSPGESLGVVIAQEENLFEFKNSKNLFNKMKNQ
jgi:hypothetical protein